MSDPAAVHRSTAAATIVYEGVHVALGGREVLAGLSCVIPAGEISVILGMSGAGKSVMMRLALGLLAPDRGRVVVDGHDLAAADHTELTALRREFGVAFQGGALFTSLDVAENVAFPLREHTDLGEAEIAARVQRLLVSVGLPDAGELHVDQLSGGMLKRVAFARALALEPRIVFLDEPSSGLDPVIAARIDDVILRLHRERPATFFVITHDIESARNIADHIGLLDGGRLVRFEPAEAFLTSDSPVVRQLLERRGEGPIQPGEGPLEPEEVPA